MTIDCLSDTDVYVERKVEATITVNTTKNENGILEVDDFGNLLVSIIDTGETEYSTLESYSGRDGVMLYNTMTNEIQVCKVGDTIRVRNDYIRGTRYYTGASRVLSTSVNNKTFTVPINGKKVLKVQLMGRDIKAFASIDNTIRILGSEAFLVDAFSEITVYLYDEVPTTFSIKYFTYRKVWDDTMGDHLFWENDFIGNKLENFNEASISSSVEEDITRNSFGDYSKRTLNSVDNQINMTTFNGSGLFNIVDNILDDEFRIIFFNGYYRRVVLVNNCIISDNVNIIYDKNKNTKSFTIYCGNYIDINNGSTKIYGDGKYGTGGYGGDKTIKNSSRLGG
jgi:hypothetical protein